jgi:hypothetical protein
MSSGAPDSLVHHRTATEPTVHVWCSISFHIGRNRPLGLGTGWRTVQSGATIWPLARPRVARWSRRRPLAAGAFGSPDSPVHHRTVRWFLATLHLSFPESNEFVAEDLGAGADDSPDSPVHHRTVPWFIAMSTRRFPRAETSPPGQPEHRILSGAPPDSSVCQAGASLADHRHSFFNHFYLFLVMSLTFR